MLPEEAGANVTAIEQLLAGGRLAGQLFDCLKSAVSDNVMPETNRLPVPMLATRTCCAVLDVPTPWLPNAKLGGAIAEVETPMPVPDSCTTCWTPASFDVIARVPPFAPTRTGEKVTKTEKEALAARLDGQLFVCWKPGIAAMLEIANAAVPVFETVTVCGALEVPVFWLANVKLDGDTAPTGAPSPVPDKGMTIGLLGVL